MSLRTRIRGLTAWVNVRLLPYGEKLSNVVADLLQGMHLKYLIESISGKDIKRLQSFDGLTDQQKVSRIEWVVADLKACGVLPDSVCVNYKQCAAKSADHVLELLWRLASYDTCFLWERLEFLARNDDDVITEVSFQWVPDPQPLKKKRTSVKKSMLSGFGSASYIEEEEHGTDSPDDEWIKFPGADFMKSFKRRKKKSEDYQPTTKECILDMIQTVLKMTDEGRKLHCSTLLDACDSRIWCALINAFVPNTFTTDLLLNDRWTINTALRTAEAMFHMTSKFDSADLVQGNEMAVCAYFCSFFMMAFKFKQSKAATQRYTWLQQMVREFSYELQRVTADDNIDVRRHLQTSLDKHKDDLTKIKKRFDMEECFNWVHHVQLTQDKLHKDVKQKMSERFEVVLVPRNATVTDLCQSLFVNLSICGGFGFYRGEEKESFNDSRRLVLRDVSSGNFIDDLDRGNKGMIRKLIGMAPYGVCEIDPKKFPQYEFYFECSSKNKQLKAGSGFLYQVFPSNRVAWQKQLLRACRDADMDAVGKFVTFFRNNPSFINCRESRTRNTPLHLACRNGHYKIVLFLLENGAKIDALNNFRATPIFSAIEGIHRTVCHLLIEWGCDVRLKNIRGCEPFETAKNAEFRQYLIGLYERYRSFVPAVMTGDMSILRSVITDHVNGDITLCSLNSRCVNGSTLLHTAAYHGCTASVTNLLLMRVDANIRDYKNATPLHRSRDVRTMQILLDAGARVNLTDGDGNTPLHIRCYGEANQDSEIDCVKLLLSRGVDVFHTNNAGLLAVHCAAMQGRTDLIAVMLSTVGSDRLTMRLNEDTNKLPPSVIHLAIVGDCIDAAKWLLEMGFIFKDGEPDLLMKRILLEQVKISRRCAAIELLLHSGADPQPTYRGGQTPLHYAAAMSNAADAVQLLLGYGADVNVVNLDGSTPLFVATNCRNPHVASVLINSGADVRQKNYHGVTALDNIVDFDEWLDSGYFSDEIQAHLKAYDLKYSRDLVRSISSRVKGHNSQNIPDHLSTDRTFSKSLTSLTDRPQTRFSNWSRLGLPFRATQSLALLQS